MPPERSLAHIDVNLLVTLDVLLQERSVTRAAERLSLTQPAVSGSLARLRTLFADDLLVRAGATMRPTPLAERLAGPLRASLEGLTQTVFPSGFDPREHHRTFAIAATDYVTLVLVRPLVDVLAREAPGMRIRTAAAGLSEATPRLRFDDADLAIVPARFVSTSTLPTRALFTDRFVAAAWSGRTDLSDPLTFAELRASPYLSYHKGAVPTLVEQRLCELGEAVEPATLVESFVVGALMLRGTRQVTFLQERLARMLAGPAELQLLEPPCELPTVVETMAWHPRATDDPAHRWLRERIVALADELGDGGLTSRR
jgi:DNA-binding transcriptional LysR family regulator